MLLGDKIIFLIHMHDFKGYLANKITQYIN